METVIKDYYIQLDTKYKITGETIKLVQSDNNGNIFHLTLTENDEPIDLTGATVSITLKKADGKVVVNYCTITDALNGKCDYTVDVQALTYVGQVIYSVEIYSNSGRVTTNQAKFKVVAELDDGSSAPSDGNYNILATLIEEVNTTENNIIDNETIRQDNEDVRIANETTRQSQEQTRIDTFNTNEANRIDTFNANETIRQDNEDVRISNENTRLTEFSQIKEDYNTASNYTVVSSLEGSYIASEDNTMSFILPMGVFNPLVDVVRLFYRGAFLSENLHYLRTGSEITLGFVIQKDEQIDFQIDKAVINEIPGADGGVLMEKSVKQMSLSEDVQEKLNYAGVKTIDGKFTATSNNTTKFTITEDYNPTKNVLRLYYEGCYLEKGVSYTQIGSEITLSFPINTGEEINYQIERNVSVEVPQADGSNLMNDSVGIIKLTEDVRSKVNEVLEIKLKLDEKAAKTFVTYKEFGAVLDGVTDDSVAILACHAYANENNLNVVQNGGKVLCNFTVDVKTSCELNVDFIINDLTPYTVYNIISDTEVADYEYTGSFTTDQINGFDNFKGKFFVPRLDNDTWKLGIRATDTSNQIYYHRQPVAVDNNGNLISSPIYLGNAGTFTIKYCKDISEKGVVFSGGVVVSTLSKIGFPRLIKCSRNNCTIKDIAIYNTKLPTSTDNYASGLINIIGCANVKIKNVNGLNNSVDVTTARSYILDFTDTYNISVDDSNLTQGWGAVASHFCDTLTFNKCIINRCDNHYGAFGKYSITDCTLTGIGTICAGYGNANFTIDNVTFNNTYPTSYVFYTRNDFNITFSGTLTLSNIRFLNEVFTRIINYQLGSGTANIELSKGKINIIADNIISTKALILNSTETTVSIKIYNSEIVPCASNGSCAIDIYSSKLRSVVSTATTRLYSCEIISFASTFTSTIFFYSCYIYPDINNANISLFASNCQMGNINNSSKAYLIACWSATAKTVTAITTKSLTGCLNIT